MTQPNQDFMEDVLTALLCAVSSSRSPELETLLSRRLMARVRSTSESAASRPVESGRQDRSDAATLTEPMSDADQPASPFMNDAMLDAGFRIFVESAVSRDSWCYRDAVGEIYLAMAKAASGLPADTADAGDGQEPAAATAAMIKAGLAVFFKSNVLDYRDYERADAVFEDVCAGIYAAMENAKAAPLRLTDAMLDAGAAMALATNLELEPRNACRRIYIAMARTKLAG